MGDKLKHLFESAIQRGGVTFSVKLAVRTCITRQMAATMPDTPEALAAVQRAIDELAREQAASPVPATTTRATGATATAGGRIKKYFDFAREHGGVPLTASLALKTCITSQTAVTTPDTTENLKKVRRALADLLPGITIPQF